MLAERGFNAVAEARSAVAALETASRSKPEVIVIDIELCGRRGVGIVKELVARVPGCAIVVLSHDDALRFPALEAGAFCFVGRHDLRDFRRCLGRIHWVDGPSPEDAGRAAP